MIVRFVAPKKIKVALMDSVDLPELNGTYSYATSIGGLDIFIHIDGINGSIHRCTRAGVTAHDLLSLSEGVPADTLSSRAVDFFTKLPETSLEILQQKDDEKCPRNIPAEAQQWINKAFGHVHKCRVITVNSSRGELLMYMSGRVNRDMPALRVYGLSDDDTFATDKVIRRSDRSLVRDWKMTFAAEDRFTLLAFPRFSGAVPGNVSAENKVYVY